MLSRVASAASCLLGDRLRADRAAGPTSLPWPSGADALVDGAAPLALGGGPPTVDAANDGGPLFERIVVASRAFCAFSAT